jgi:hypothetical protein
MSAVQSLYDKGCFSETGVFSFLIINFIYSLNCTTPLLNILARTCFGSSLPSSSFLDPSELPEMQIE